MTTVELRETQDYYSVSENLSEASLTEGGKQPESFTRKHTSHTLDKKEKPNATDEVEKIMNKVAGYALIAAAILPKGCPLWAKGNIAAIRSFLDQAETIIDSNRSC